jgi:hypothetical protein
MSKLLIQAPLLLLIKVCILQMLMAYSIQQLHVSIIYCVPDKST